MIAKVGDYIFVENPHLTKREGRVTRIMIDGSGCSYGVKDKDKDTQYATAWRFIVKIANIEDEPEYFL